MDADFGFREFRHPFWPPNVVNRRLAVLDETGLVELTELTEAIPGVPGIMSSDPQGRIFVVSWEMEGNRVLDDFLSWWEVENMGIVHTLSTSDIMPPWAGIRDYPIFGPDGLVYLLVCCLDSSWKYAVLCIDPQTEEFHGYSRLDYPLLDSTIRYFYVDPMNVKWFGTEDGLVRFDGESWSRYTTANSALPHDLVVEMAYDEIDQVYYVVSHLREWEDREDYAALSIFSQTGRRVGDPLYLRSRPRLHRGADDVWYLMTDYVNGTIYSYDHEQVRRWRLSDWIDIGLLDHESYYVGQTRSGRTYCVPTTEAIIIW